MGGKGGGTLATRAAGQVRVALGGPEEAARPSLSFTERNREESGKSVWRYLY